jgi:hypothetical protein
MFCTGGVVTGRQRLTLAAANPTQGRQRVPHPERVRVRRPREPAFARRKRDMIRFPQDLNTANTTKWDTREAGQAHGKTGVWD